MEGHVLQLSLQMYGCRVVQKVSVSLQWNLLRTYVAGQAIEHILPEQQGSLVKELEPHAIQCVKDANGNHVRRFLVPFFILTTEVMAPQVIQRMIERISPERLGFVSAFRGHVQELATHPYGCRVLQRCLEYLNDDQARPLLDELRRCATQLMQDQFGVRCASWSSMSDWLTTSTRTT